MEEKQGMCCCFFLETTCKVIGTNTHTQTQTDTSDAGVRCFVSVECVECVDEQQGLFGSEAGVVVVVVVDGRGSTHTHTARAMGRAQQASKQAK